MSLVVNAMKEGEEYSASFEEHSQLWLEDPEEFLQRFLTSRRASSPGEPEEPPPHGPPPLQLFKQEVPGGSPGDTQCPWRFWMPRDHQPWAATISHPQIDSCEALCEEVSGFANTCVFGGWLQSDCRPFKQALLSAIRRRELVLKQYLTNLVTTR